MSEAKSDLNNLLGISVCIEKPFCIHWQDIKKGFGEFWFYEKDGKIHCDNEMMSPKYVEKIMRVLVAQSVMRDA